MKEYLELKHHEKLLGITKQCILEKSNDNPEDQNTLKKAEEEYERIMMNEKEKALKLEKFKKIVNERVNLYKNAQRMLNADKDLKIMDKSKMNDDININFKSLKKQSLNDVKTKLASKINIEKLKIDQCYSNENNEKDSIQNHTENKEHPEVLVKKISSFTLKALLENLKKNSKNNVEQNRRYSTTRKVFSDLEREKAKNFSNKSKNIQYINDLKYKKEKVRLIEELDLEIRQDTTQNFIINNYIEKEESSSNKLPKTPKTSILKKKRIYNTNPLPLCQCKSNNNYEINECASNCIFYKNNMGKFLFSNHEY